jgi:glucose/arabinose dehydrogenase
MKSLSAVNEALPPGFAQVRLAQGLAPKAMAITPDGRILVAEKNGRVLIVENGMLLPEPLAVVVVDSENERGLSGIAIHLYSEDGSPDIAINPESKLISVGESATFTTMASGTQPIYYQGQRDMADIPWGNFQIISAGQCDAQ